MHPGTHTPHRDRLRRPDHLGRAEERPRYAGAKRFCTHPQLAADDGSSEAIHLRFDLDPRIHFSMQQNDVPVLKAVQIENRSEDALRDLVIWRGKLIQL